MNNTPTISASPPENTPRTGTASPGEIELSICKVAASENCDTTKLFDSTAPQELWSPIDDFIRTTKLLNVLLASRVLSSPPVEAQSIKTAENEIDLALLAIEDEEDSPPEEGDQEPAKTEEQLTSTDTQETPYDRNPPFPENESTDLPLQVIEQTNNCPKSAPPQGDMADDRGKPEHGVIPLPHEVDAQLNNLVLLGFISAVESYLRSLTTRLVWIDPHVEKKVEDMKLSYGAARHHRSIELLAEAFLEDMTFISKEKIESLFRQILGLEKIPERVQLMLREYERICQLRHCIVHRFGKLGTKNAINLGLKEHRELLEKPIQITAAQLQDMALSLFMTVKTINNFVYDGVLKRQAKLSTEWTWDYAIDAARFRTYYEVFSTKLDAEPSEKPELAYVAFQATCKDSSATHIAARKEEKQRRIERKSVDRPF